MAPNEAAMEPPMARAEERLRKSRREGVVVILESVDMAGTLAGREGGGRKATADGVCLLLIVNPAHGGPVIEDPGVRPGVVGSVGGGEDADDEQHDRKAAAIAAAAEMIDSR